MTGSPTPSTVQAHRDRRVLDAVAWTGAGRYAGQLFRWSSTVVVARVLSPSDYGLVGMTALLSGLVALLAEFGVGAAVLRLRDPDAEELAQLNGLAVFLGLIAMGVSLLAAWPLALFFRRPELTGIIAVSSLGFVITSFQTVPGALLQRDLRFKSVAAVELASAVTLALLVLLLALGGAGYWALVIPSLFTGALASLQFRRLARVGLAWPRLSRIRDSYRYSLWVIAGRLSNYLYFSADFLMVGRLLGSAALGSYTFAWDLANTPNDQINGLVARVSTPFFASMQGDRQQIARLFTTLLEGVSCISIPLMLGLAAVAPEFIPLLLGDQWTGAVPILQVLCVFAAMRVMTILISPLLVMVGDARFQSVLTFIALLYMPPLFVLGAKYHGPEGVAMAWLLGYPPIIIALFYRTARHCGIPIAELLRSLYPSLVASAVMLAAVAGCRHIVPADVALPLRLALYILSGMLAYGLTLLLAFRSRVMTFVSFIRKGLTASAKPAPQTVAPVHPSAPPG